MELTQIGTIHKHEGDTMISLDERYADGLLGIEGFSHIIVCYWLHENDTPAKRETLQVHPRKDESIPLTGVFATHSPLRPNPLAITVCRLLAVDGCSLRIDEIDAFDGSPVVDIKCYIDWAMPRDDVLLPDWV
jgi:tRNA-Thr(GGU) m(6)t(6)A37 methyltransferase TsaA